MKYGNRTNYWIVEGDHFDISRGSAKTTAINMEDNRTLQFDPERSAFIIIDMQNYFCSPLSWAMTTFSSVIVLRQLRPRTYWKVLCIT
jgi:isochorismate hydrolase